jgi:DNA-damage-inducible protein J
MAGHGMRKKKDAVLNIRISSDVKDESAKILKELGLDHSKAINIFLHQVVMQNGIPFDVALTKDKT